MLNIAICDDDVKELENTYLMVSNFINEYNEADYKIRNFQSPYELMDCIASNVQFDIYLLDIIMPEINGIDIGEKIRKKNESAIIIYLSNTADYAIKSYEVSAFYYLVKPVEQKMLAAVLKHAIDKIDVEKSKNFTIKTKDSIKLIPYHHIVYMEFIDRVVNVHLADHSIVTSVTMREPFDTMVEKILQDKRFIRSHTSFVVNMRFISSITSRDFVMTDHSLVPVSRNKYAEIKNGYLDFLLGEGNTI